VTPAAPSTGSGAPPATSGLGLLLATLGIIALGAGCAVLACAKRS
jgi:hypothetical protein